MDLVYEKSGVFMSSRVFAEPSLLFRLLRSERYGWGHLSPAGLRQPQGDRLAHNLRAVGGIQLAAEADHVIAHGGAGDLGFLGDLLIG